MNIRKILSALLFTEKCSICGNAIELKKGICNCLGNEKVPIGEDFCHHCAQQKDGCTCCYENSFSLAHVTAVYVYSGAVRQHIHALKFEKNKKIATVMAQDMSERVARVFPKADFDLVTYVPSHRLTVKERGYNQSQLLAANVAESFFLPCIGVLEKTKQTPFQHKISASERGQNLVGSIICTSDVKNKTVLLCDDVKTTGATLNECVKALMQQGAKDVYCVCYASSEYRQDIF